MLGESLWQCGMFELSDLSFWLWKRRRFNHELNRRLAIRLAKIKAKSIA